MTFAIHTRKLAKAYATISFDKIAIESAHGANVA